LLGRVAGSTSGAEDVNRPAEAFAKLGEVILSFTAAVDDSEALSRVELPNSPV
jgi:hypothetical protein